MHEQELIELVELTEIRAEAERARGDALLELLRLVLSSTDDQAAMDYARKAISAF